ncbi:MAG: ribose 5-phosphate isomerase B [Candidatus Magnetobacterium sp. LHC-1]|uniref:Ribose 5-phosphate isomerase B n=1 Tax=Candidatus Magnetobacterium casense TaxID=1455061 RepID=A0ABS6S315_9BACT|nr:ribose 5-phosphate isomerase B [Candidatus Magnetobacterium casensis]MBF0608452.1 ribose 5-phosphate isomerase B [Nitrospirota bacterium]MBV6343236.1 ribose 5-phosphate isomerase B [Candidatus Magnetobacterium casensis]
MVIAAGCDHAGVLLKRALERFLVEGGTDVIDVGTSGETSVDYPDFAASVASMVSSGEVDRGILICGSGIGMSIVANKFRGIRAALCNDLYSAAMSRMHNDTNILVMGSRIVATELAIEIVKVWLMTEFSGGRHELRIKKISKIEESIAEHK